MFYYQYIYENILRCFEIDLVDFLIFRDIVNIFLLMFFIFFLLLMLFFLCNSCLIVRYVYKFFIIVGFIDLDGFE